ncbi:MAG: hypothetical protein PHP59_03820 [Methanofollis sp.]|uniref:hypothetical protein n=1 Tax=Methanofollis sp. TaxID=2052835 RepID=UPI002629FB9D|nr:hypothetical protein [Methanofollis sp.]MDD4254484.1 hypothetical protein [Methanofollis sp.]
MSIQDLTTIFSKIKNISGAKKTGGVFVSYILLTVLLTYPVAFHIGSDIPGGGDAFYWMYSLWYTIYAVMHPGLTNLTYNTMQFHPYGIPTMPFPSAFNQALYLLMSPFFELHVIYTILWLLTFILGAFGAYLLVKYLTGSTPAAYISGVIFAFAPYHFVHALGHFGATSIGWIPFCALYLMKTFREGGRKNSILAGIFFVLVAMSDLQYMVFMGLFALLLCLYELYRIHSDEHLTIAATIQKVFTRYLPFGLVSLAGVLPLTINDILVATSGTNFLKPDPMEAVTYSTDLLSFFLPCQLHPIFGSIVTPIYTNFSGNSTEHTTYIGYAVLMLALFAFLKLRSSREVQFWTISAVSFSLLSLGPMLSINGETQFSVFNTTVPLPHLLLYYLIPFLDNCRTTGRFYVIAALAFAVLAGYGIAELLKRRTLKKDVLVVLIAGVVIFEYLCVPYPTSYVDQPEFYREIARDNENYALLEIPATTNYGAGIKIEYYQTIHGKPIVGGQVARTPSGARSFEMNTPIISDLTYLKDIQDIISEDKSDIAGSVLSYYNIRYIVIHKNYLSKEEIDFLKAYSHVITTDESHIREDEDLIAIKNPHGVIGTFTALGNGWQNLENWAGTPTRWTDGNATITIYSKMNTPATMNLTVRSFHLPRTLEIFVNDHLLTETQVNTSFHSIGVPITLMRGENIVRLHVLEDGERPCEVSEKSKDTRKLSIAVQNISIQ